MDSFFPNADFFVEFECFDCHIEKLKRNNTPLDFVSVCSPNYLHDSHIRFVLRRDANVICEKPIVLNPWNIDALEDIEKKGNIYTILQLRHHPSIIALKKKVEEGDPNKIYDIDLSYLTSRGHWYSMNGEEIEFSGSFTDLHSVSYQHVLVGTCYRIGDTRQAIEIVHDIRDKEAVA